MEGNPRLPGERRTCPTDIGTPQFAEMLGLTGIAVDTPEGLKTAPGSSALAADRPVVLDVRTDPEVAPLPPHVTLVQAKAFMSSMAKGDRRVGQVVADTARQLVEGVKERL